MNLISWEESDLVTCPSNAEMIVAISPLNITNYCLRFCQVSFHTIRCAWLLVQGPSRKKKVPWATPTVKVAVARELFPKYGFFYIIFHQHSPTTRNWNRGKWAINITKPMEVVQWFFHTFNSQHSKVVHSWQPEVRHWDPSHLLHLDSEIQSDAIMATFWLHFGITLPETNSQSPWK